MTKLTEMSRVISAICKTPWAITPEGLDLVIAIAQRTTSDIEAAADIRGQRALPTGYAVDNGVAVIPVIGTIMPRASAFDNVSGATSAQAIANQLTEAVNDPMVRSIVLHIDSPGGQVGGIHELADQIFNARDAKPVTAYVSGMGASAAYWIASAADTIIAEKTAQLGSIGVRAAWEDDKAVAESKGIKRYSIVSSQSPQKGLDPATDEGRAQVQQTIDAMADIFISDVARNRGVHKATVAEKFGKGSTLMADDAVKVGMADSIGTLSSVISASAERGLNLMKGVTMNANQANEPTKGDTPQVTAPALVMTADEYRASNPTAYAAIIAEGAAQERARIKAIEDIGLEGHEALVASAKFDNPISASDLSMAILKAEKTKRENHAASYKQDATNMPIIPVGDAGTNATGADASKKADDEKGANLLAEAGKAMAAMMAKQPGGVK